MNNCNPNFHKVTALTQGSSSIEMTLTNSTNISSLDYFELVLCVNPKTVVTGSALPYTATINGTAGIPVYNKYSLPIYSNRLHTRKRYFGSYVVNGSSSYIILWNTPDCPMYAKQ